MHELSIAQAILAEVEDVAAQRGIERVTGIRLRVGELSSVVSDALLFAWELAAEGTIAAGSRLAIERIPVEVYCPNCRTERPPVSANFLTCVTCGTPTPEIVRGRELLVVAMEVADADPRDGSSAIDSEEKLDAGVGTASPF